MVNPKELRIGSLVYNENTNTVKLIYYGDFAEMYIEDTGMVKSFDPIPLTEEWLVKLGFIQSDCETDYMEWDKYPISIGNDGGLNDYKNQPFYYEIEWDYKKEIKYVHQLQGLYFALTGEELSPEGL